MRSQRCGKCGGEMTEGFVIDSSHQAARVAHWAEGAPSYWFLRILRMKGRGLMPIATWRCRKCGFLESYATPGVS